MIPLYWWRLNNLCNLAQNVFKQIMYSWYSFPITHIMPLHLFSNFSMLIFIVNCFHLPVWYRDVLVLFNSTPFDNPVCFMWSHHPLFLGLVLMIISLIDVNKSILVFSSLLGFSGCSVVAKGSSNCHICSGCCFT